MLRVGKNDEENISLRKLISCLIYINALDCISSRCYDAEAESTKYSRIVKLYRQKKRNENATISFN